MGKIDISFPWDLPDRLTGPAVMLDVISASFNIVYLVGHAKELYVTTHANVYAALENVPDAVLIGESDDPVLKKKFIATNSAAMIVQTPVEGKKVIFISFNGTQTIGELLDKGAKPVIVANYANMHAVAKWLLSQHQLSDSITLVPSGGREEIFAANHNLDEDLLAALALEELLRGNEPDFETYFKKSRQSLLRNYPIDKQPSKSLPFVFTASDTYPVIPICEKLPNGLLTAKAV
jgi:phosphosulfolactate phosphohydrolase-like enzyme